MRRKPLDYFFSVKSVQTYECLAIDKVNLLEERLQALSNTGTIVNMEHAYAALVGDIISAICVVNPSSLLLGPDFSPGW